MCSASIKGFLLLSLVSITGFSIAIRTGLGSSFLLACPVARLDRTGFTISVVAVKAGALVVEAVTVSCLALAIGSTPLPLVALVEVVPLPLPAAGFELAASGIPPPIMAAAAPMVPKRVSKGHMLSLSTVKLNKDTLDIIFYY